MTGKEKEKERREREKKKEKEKEKEREREREITTTSMDQPTLRRNCAWCRVSLRMMTKRTPTKV